MITHTAISVNIASIDINAYIAAAAGGGGGIFMINISHCGTVTVAIVNFSSGVTVTLYFVVSGDDQIITQYFIDPVNIASITFRAYA